VSGSGPPRDPPPVRGRTRRAAELGLAAAALLVAAAGSELALRALGIAYPPFYRTSADVGDSLLPGSEGWWTQEGRAHVRINADGMRDRDHDVARPPGTFRIAVLGDSYAEAFQVEQGEAFWAVLERALRGCPRLDGRRPELLNFGVAGYGTTQQLLMLQRRVWKYAPDLVLLLFTTGNDVRNNSKTLQGGGRPYLRLVDGEAVLDTSFLDKRSSRWRTSRAGDLWYAALQRSRLLQVLAQAPRAWRRLWEPDPARPAPGPPIRTGWRRGRSRRSRSGASRRRCGATTPACCWPPAARRSRWIPTLRCGRGPPRRSGWRTSSTRIDDWPHSPRPRGSRS
jgi:hypothetical protein